MLVAERLAIMVVGGPERVAKGLQQIIDGTQADELIIVSDAFRHEDRMRADFALRLLQVNNVGDGLPAPDGHR